jgi:hypothetical protein
MSNRSKIILIVSAGLLIIAAILIYFIFFDKGVALPKDETAPVAKLEPTKADDQIKIAPATPQEKTASSLKAVAVTFAERFGSFSNQSEYLNLIELTSLMTGKMSGWINDSYIPKLKKDFAPTGFYYEITTSAPVTVVLAQNETTAKVKISTQRREQKANQALTEFLQDLILDLVKTDNNWLVDAAYWQSKK